MCEGYYAVMDTFVMPLRLNLKDWRAMRGLTQAELAEKAGVTQPTISDIENGVSKSVSFDVLDRLARALTVEPGALIERVPEKRGKGR
jgi:transcriptional regulator with XRE-family HTH domain